MKSKDKIVDKKPFAGVQMVAAVTLFVVLAVILFSCGKRVEAGGKVPFEPCLCEEKNFVWGSVQFPSEAYLFSDNIPEQMRGKINLGGGSDVCYIQYSKEMNVASIIFLAKNSGEPLFDGLICNFPDFAKEWTISHNGCKVSFKGISYFPCNYTGSDDRVRFDFILTSLKKNEKKYNKK